MTMIHMSNSQVAKFERMHSEISTAQVKADEFIQFQNK